MKLTDKQMLMILGAGGLLLWYVKNKAVGLAANVGQAVNPVNPDNIFYGGVNSVGGALSDNPDFSLGAWIYDITHDDEVFDAG